MTVHPKITDLPDGRKLAILQGNDAISMMIDVWLCGFVSGGSSAIALVAPNASEETGDRLAQQLADGITRDPLAVEAVRQQVIEIITGRDSGAQSVKVDLPGGDDQP